MNKNQSKIVSISAAVITMLLGIMVLVGWFTHNDFEDTIVPGQETMTFNVALGFIFSSIVLLLSYFPEKNKALRAVSLLLSGAVLIIGLLTLIEYISGFSTGINSLFFNNRLPATIYHWGEMSPL